LRDKRLFNSKIAKFSHLCAFSAPGLRGSPWNWVSALGVKKLESCATGTRKKFDDIFSLTDTIHQRDGLTPDDSKDRAYTQCRAVKNDSYSYTSRKWHSQNCHLLFRCNAVFNHNTSLIQCKLTQRHLLINAMSNHRTKLNLTSCS